MLKIIVAGAAGRMGRRLVANIQEDPDLTLAGATECPGSPWIGMDAGEVAGSGKNGVKISDSLAGAIQTSGGADAVINFSTGNVIEDSRFAAQKGLALIIGTTALGEEGKQTLKNLAENGAKIVLASNFSAGVNLLFHLAARAAEILSDDFDIEIIEAHHNRKKDAPSGTAASLAEILCKKRGLNPGTSLRNGRAGITGARTKNEIGVHAIRGGDIVGDHMVLFAAQGERVELVHRASSRDTFAKGALRAAKFLASAKCGLYDMQDVLGLK